MPSRNAVTLALLMICSACAGNQTHNEADTLPDSKVAIIEVFPHKGEIFNERHFSLRYFDGTEGMKLYSDLGHGRIMPGRHTLGVVVNWGDFCLPGSLFGNLCFNYCYSGIVLKAEAGRKYSYDLEKTKDEVNVVVSDETGVVATKALCESFSIFNATNTSVIKTINERLERESNEGEIQDKAQ